MDKLPLSFFQRDVLDVSPDLLGKILVRRFDDGVIGRYRIFICYKYAKKDKYKTMEVVASHCNANNLKLRFRSKFCGFWFSKMLLRWKKEEDSLLLQMRCKFPKITLSQIQYRITELWSYTENDNR